ncbi:MAG: hypothetical protein IPM07_16875 [Anaerolineales bacterium]|nr:hypothetical protein [Anaerolineales bacterium]
MVGGARGEGEGRGARGEGRGARGEGRGARGEGRGPAFTHDVMGMHAMQLPVDRYAVVEGLRLRYWLEGEDGPHLVLIHGIGGSVDVWRKQFEQLPHPPRPGARSAGLRLFCDSHCVSI